MATSIAAVATICASPPTAQVARNRALRSGRTPPLSTQAKPAMTTANGSPNRKRTSVAPHGPASASRPRCVALRAT